MASKNEYLDFTFPGSWKATIKRRKETYHKTASGRSWQKTPTSVEEETVDARFYTNCVQSIPFFNSFGFGASCRAQWNYTKCGYIPTRITMISPNQTERIVEIWSFNE